LGKLGGDWAWLVGDKVLEVTSGDVGTIESEDIISITLLSQLGCDWAWLIGDKVFEMTSGDIGSVKGENVVAI